MTNRERIIQTLLCRKTDRAPFGVGIGFGTWRQTLERWRAESGVADLDPAAHFGYDQGFLRVPVECVAFPHTPDTVLTVDDEFITAEDWRGITMRNRRDAGSLPEFIAHPIRTAEDWAAYKAERLQTRLDERLAAVPEFAETARATDAPVQIGGYPLGIFGTLRDFLGAEKLLVDFYDRPDLVRDMMETCVSLWLAIYERVLEQVQVDYLYIWEDMSGKQGSLISMHMVEEFMMPHYDRIRDFARAHGIRVTAVDSDGLVNELVPTMVRHGVNAFLPFEVQAGNDVEEYRRLYPGLGIIGGLDKNALARSRRDIHRELDRAGRMLAAGGYIPGCDHSIPPNVSWENWTYFVGHLRNIIGA